MPKSYSLHIAGNHPRDSNNPKFKAGAEHLFQMADDRGFTPMMVTADVHSILRAVNCLSEEMKKAGGGTFLLTYTGHGTNNTACKELDSTGEGWALNGVTSLHKESIRKLLIGKFPPPITPIILSDSCYSMGIYYEFLYKLIARGRDVLNLDALRESLDAEQLQLVMNAVTTNEDICKQTAEATEPDKSTFIYISAGHAGVDPAALSNLVYSIFSGEKSEKHTYQQLEDRLKTSLSATNIDGPEALMNAPAMVPLP